MMCFRGTQVVEQLHDMYWIEDVSLDYSNKFADGCWIIKVRIGDGIVGVNVPACQNGKKTDLIKITWTLILQQIKLKD